MRVLFLGGTGNISAACVERALELGHEVTVLNRGRRARPQAINHGGDPRMHAVYDILLQVPAVAGGWDSAARYLPEWKEPERLEKQMALRP